jgi:hypothetical protein
MRSSQEGPEWQVTLHIGFPRYLSRDMRRCVSSDMWQWHTFGWRTVCILEDGTSLKGRGDDGDDDGGGDDDEGWIGGGGGGGPTTVIASHSNYDVGRAEALGGGGAEETLTRAMLLPLLLIPTLTSFTRKSASENYVTVPLGIHRVGWIWLDVCRHDYDNNRCRGTTPTWRKP